MQYSRDYDPGNMEECLMADKRDLTIEEMSDQYFDVLKEIGNIGAGNATTALSTMLGSRVDMMAQTMLSRCALLPEELRVVS